MLFPVIDTEALVQEHDKTRLDASKSYASGESITQIEIKPSAADAWYDVTTDQYLDWQYTMTDPVNTPRENFTVSVRLNGTEVSTKQIEVISEAEDNLFSSDDQLRKHEHDILKYIPAGRASFKDVHRRAQTLIIAWLNKEGYIDDFGDAYNPSRFVSNIDVAEWSCMMALRLIMESMSNAVDDVFAKKAQSYQKLETFYQNRSVIRLDKNQNGTVEDFEATDVRTCIVVRR